MRTHEPRRSFLWLALVGLSCASAYGQTDPIESADLGDTERGGARRLFSLWAGHSESDNAIRSTVPTRGAYDSFGTEIDVLRDRERLSAGAVGNVEFRTYEQNVAEDETVGSLDAFANFGFIPDRITWLVEGSLSQGRSDPFSADRPENREDVYTLSTGPTFNVPLGARTVLVARGLRSRREYDETLELDSDASTYGIGLSRRVRRSKTVGLLAETTETEYDSTIAGYDISSIQLSYEATGLRGSITAAVGSNEVESGDLELTEPMFQLGWERSFAARSSVAVSLDRGFTDAGQLFASNGAGLSRDALLVGDITDQKSLSVSYGLTFERTQVSIQAASLRDAFQRDAIYSGDARQLSVEMERTVTRALSVGMEMVGIEREFVDLVDGIRHREINLWANMQIGRRLGMTVELQRDRGDGLDAYREKSYHIRFLYTRDRSVQQ